VIPAEFDYLAPASLDEALQALRDGGEDAKVLAGGHSLIPLMKLRLAAPTLLVDLRRVPGLTGVSRDNGTIRFGAMVRHHAVATGGFGLPSKAAATIADQQVRNAGTIGGTLAHGDPASDLPAVLLASEGSVTARAASGGERTIAAADLFEDYLTTALAPDEIIVSVDLPAHDGWGHGYEKFTRRAEDWAMVGVCALVKAEGGQIQDARVAFTNMAATPIRAEAVESALRDQGLDAIPAAAEAAAEGTDPPGDLNATPDYKRHRARGLTKRALQLATAG
jgi:aerobic carbon-monoxide dehydrogenase medium subunit